MARRLDAPVEWLGWVDRSTLAALLAGAGALLMPSRYRELSPYSALEAMAAGVPVVATKMGGLPELIGAERCLPVNDTDAVAARLRELWDDPARRRDEGARLLARAREHHSEDRYLHELLALYERAFV